MGAGTLARLHRRVSPASGAPAETLVGAWVGWAMWGLSLALMTAGAVLWVLNRDLGGAVFVRASPALRHPLRADHRYLPGWPAPGRRSPADHRSTIPGRQPRRPRDVRPTSSAAGLPAPAAACYKALKLPVRLAGSPWARAAVASILSAGDAIGRSSLAPGAGASRRLWVESWRLRGGKHSPLVGYALQGMPAAILEGDPGPHDEVLDGR
jgi:hypothetical protein